MTDKVVSLRGDSITQHGQANDMAVMVAKTLVEETESGYVVGVVIVKRHADGSVSSETGGDTINASVLGMLAIAQSDLIKQWDK